MIGLEYKIQERWFVFRLVHGKVLAMDEYFNQFGYDTKEDAIQDVWSSLGHLTDRFILPETQIRRKD